MNKERTISTLSMHAIQRARAAGGEGHITHIIINMWCNIEMLVLQLLNIKRFLQDFHSTPGADGGGSERPLLLAPDLLLECEDFLFQLCEDPFEAKLRANYEVGVVVGVVVGGVKGL